MLRFQNLTGALCLLTISALGTPAMSQTAEELAPEDSFSLEAAILDTSIPFAVGAHEARQELRGAFGWPTFQEGLVEGVYFRFDPDGYARFSPTPRLDTDVFEVICRPRTHVCMARKGAMNVTLNSNNLVQLELENVTGADSFSIMDGISELQLPSAILQPLDSRMELLLSAGGDLLISRSQKEVDRVSLTGFGAVVSYLRWVSAQQSYSVLPRNWPIPNAKGASPSALLTQSAGWASPMPQPGFAANSGANADVAEVKGELRALREILFEKPVQDPQVYPLHSETMPQAVSSAELMQTLEKLSAEVARLQAESIDMTRKNMVHEMPSDRQGGPVMGTDGIDDTKLKEKHQIAVHLDYLVSEIGLDPAMAFEILNPSMSQGKTQNAAVKSMEPDLAIDLAMADQKQAIATETAREILQTAPPSMRLPNEEYQLLSEYFRSVFDAYR